jgi:hypothetical protein
VARCCPPKSSNHPSQNSPHTSDPVGQYVGLPVGYRSQALVSTLGAAGSLVVGYSPPGVATGQVNVNPPSTVRL